jgi:hypothetical protein
MPEISASFEMKSTDNKLELADCSRSQVVATISICGIMAMRIAVDLKIAVTSSRRSCRPNPLRRLALFALSSKILAKNEATLRSFVCSRCSMCQKVCEGVQNFTGQPTFGGQIKAEMNFRFDFILSGISGSKQK